jgi:hypothetical protein
VTSVSIFFIRSREKTVPQFSHDEDCPSAFIARVPPQMSHFNFAITQSPFILKVYILCFGRVIIFPPGEAPLGEIMAK